MCPGDDQDPPPAKAATRVPVGRPKVGRPRRVRITTTIEPSKLILLREHAQRAKKSLGQLADEYVDQRFPRGHSDPHDAQTVDSRPKTAPAE
jgi:hypothetical protein